MSNRKLLFLSVLSGIVVVAASVLPPIPQDESYHGFSDRRTLWGVPHFWNVISNVPFLIAASVAAWALSVREAFTATWERVAFGVLAIGVGATAFGSGYYHWNPNSQTLFWDRLPMTIVFMSLFAATIGERIHSELGRRLLTPLVIAGALSVIYWRVSGDLRCYAIVQFLPMLAIPAMLLLFPGRYEGAGGVWGMLGLYVAAKLLEMFDPQIGSVLSTGGHPWKHAAGAGAILVYSMGVAGRRPLSQSSRASSNESALAAPLDT